MSIVSRIQELIASDDCDQSERLIRDYKALSPKRREAVDDAFICLCGYSLATLIAEQDSDVYGGWDHDGGPGTTP